MVNQYYAQYAEEQGVATDPPVDEEEIPVEEEPAPAQAEPAPVEEAPAPVEEAPPPEGENEYYAKYASEQEAAAPPPADDAEVPVESGETVDPARSGTPTEVAPQGSDGPNPYYAVYQSRQTGEPLDPQFDNYATGHYVPPAPVDYGRDEFGNALPSQQAPADQNPLTRYTPFDEGVNAIVGDDGFSLGDLNPVNVVVQGLAGMGQGLDKGRQRVVEAMGEEAIDNIRKGRGEDVPEEGLLDRVGGALLNVPETLARLPLSKQSEDQIGGGDGYATWLNDPANADLILQIADTGYNGFEGGRALWEYFVSDKTMAQRGIMDVLIDPLTPITAGLGGIAALGKGAGTVGRGVAGAAKAANVVLDPIGEGVLPLAKKGIQATPIPEAIGNSPVGQFFSPSQTTLAEEAITGTAETLFGALEDADGNVPTPNVTRALPAPGTPPGTAPTPAPGGALPNLGQAAPTPQQPPTPPGTPDMPPIAPAAPAAPAQAAPTGPAIPQRQLEAAAPRGIFPQNGGAQWTDLQTGVTGDLVPDRDFPIIVERMKQASLGEYINMREQWFPLMFNGGNAPYIDAYRVLNTAGYDNYIDLMASRVRLWGDDAYNQMWNVWIEDNVLGQNWRQALDGLMTWQNVQTHSGIPDPYRQQRLLLATRIVREAELRNVPTPVLWDASRLAGRPLPEARNVIPTRRQPFTTRLGPVPEDDVPFRRIGTAPAIESADLAPFASRLRERMDQVGLGSFGLRLADDLGSNAPADAVGSISSSKRLVTLLARQDFREAVKTIDHEAIHALRTNRLLTEDEFAALRRIATNRRTPSGRTYLELAQWRYADQSLTPAQVEEEAVAELYADFASRSGSYSPEERDILSKISRVLVVIWETLTGTPEGETVMRRIQSGEVARRAPSMLDQPPAPGTVRLYRGEPRNMAPTHPADGWVNDQKRSTGLVGSYRRWFTQDLDGATDYAMSQIPDGGSPADIVIRAIDVPEDVAARSWLGGPMRAHPAAANSRAPLEEFLLPADYLDRAAPLPDSVTRDIVMAWERKSRYNIPAAEGYVRDVANRMGEVAAGLPEDQFRFDPATGFNYRVADGEQFRRIGNGGGNPPNTPRAAAMLNFLNGQPQPNWRSRLTGALNNQIDPEVIATLDRTVNGRNLGDEAFSLREDLLDVQQRLLNGATPESDPVVASMMERLDGLVTPEQLKAVDRRGINRIASLRASLDQMGDQAFKDQFPKYFERQQRVDDLSARGIARGLTQELPAAVLYNPARIAPFMTQQFLGNASSIGLAGQGSVIDRARAIGKYAGARNNIAIFKRTRAGLGATADTDTEFDRILRTAGLPLSDTFRMGGPAGEQGATLSRQLKKSSIYQKMGQIIAPQPLRDLGGVSDLSLRETLGTIEFVRLAADARQPVVNNADRLSGRFGVAVLPDQIAAAVRAAEDAARQRSGQPIYSAADLRRALEGSGAQGANTAKWADRVARDYQQALKEAYGGAKKETERVGFSFKKTNADEALGKVLFFSYWNLRASNLYARSLMKNPALLASYSRAIDALNREAEDNEYPDYLRGWLRFMSEGGTNVYFDPRRSFSTLVTLADQSFKNPDGDLNRMTALGKTLDALPGMVNPVLGSMLYAMGALGADASAPDPTGTGAIFRTGYDILNFINVARGGEPIDPKYRRPVQNFFNVLASEISNTTSGWFDDLQRVERDNPSASWQAKVNWYTQEAIREDNQDWTEEQVLAEAARVLGDLENEYVQEGIDRAARAPFEGLGSGLPVVGGLVGGISSNALGTLTRPALQDQNLATRRYTEENRENLSPAQQRAGDNAYLSRDIAQSAGQDDIAFERGVDAFWEIGRNERVQQAEGTYDAIVSGQLPGGSVEVAGRTFTDQDVAGWDEDRRQQLAEAYLRQQGDWKTLQATWDAEDKYKAAHPELREYFAFRDAAKSYPGGLERWAQETRQSNANFDQYILTMENLDEEYRPGGSKREQMLTDADAYRAAYGIPRSLYDVPMSPGPTGDFVAGIPVGLTPTQGKALGGGGDGQGGEGGTYTEEAKQKLEGDLGNYAGMVAIMNEYDAAVGNPIGTTQQTYNVKVITGDRKTKLPSDVYNAIDDAYGYVFPSQGKFKDYLTWATDATVNPEGSTSIDAFLDWDRGQFLERELSQPSVDKNAEIDITAGLRGTRDVDGNIIFGSAPAPARTSGEVVTLSTASPGLVDPYNQWSALMEVPPMLPLVPVTGANTKVVGPTADWQLVQLPDGTQVWVDAALLRRAA